MRLVFIIALMVLPVLSAVAETVTTVPLIKRGNIRYGPSLKAGVITTLNPNDTVEVIGQVPNKPGWYKVRFPRQGTAWMHKNVLLETETEGVLRVIVEGARVRSDATTGSTIVAELSMNDRVEWRGRKVSDWYAVYPPTATAYVYKSVLDLSQSAQRTIKVADRESSEAEIIWAKAQDTYRKYYDILQNDKEKALELDWASLAADLSEVSKRHHSSKVRGLAADLYKLIQRLVKASQEENNTAVAVDPAAQPTSTTEEKVNTAAKVEEDLSKPNEVIQDQANSIEGWLEAMEVPSIGSAHVILGDKGIEAFVKLPAGSGVKLEDFYWRRVRIKGDKQIVSHEVPEELKNVPLIQIESIELAR